MRRDNIMYDRAIVHLPFPTKSHISTETVKEIMAIEDFQITYSDREISWTERAIENLQAMINLAISLGGETQELEKQKSKFQNFIALKNA